jgi:hypothetical protein
MPTLWDYYKYLALHLEIPLQTTNEDYRFENPPTTYKKEQQFDQNNVEQPKQTIELGQRGFLTKPFSFLHVSNPTT